MSDIYDTAIIGGGPAGITAGIYARRMGLNAVIVEKSAFGGYLHYTDKIENYPGFSKPIEGAELAKQMTAQLFKYKIEREHKEVKGIKKAQENFLLQTNGGENILAKTVIVATGSNPGELGVSGEDEYKGKGVSYCAMCDGRLFKDKTIAVIGGGDGALKEALFLTNFVEKLYLLHDLPVWQAESYLLDKASSSDKIELHLNTEVVKIVGEQVVTRVETTDPRTGKSGFFEVNGVFIFIGRGPASEFVQDLVDVDEDGYIIVDEKMETSIEGIYAVGDVRSGSIKQIATAVGDGAVAANSVYALLNL